MRCHIVLGLTSYHLGGIIFGAQRTRDSDTGCIAELALQKILLQYWVMLERALPQGTQHCRDVESTSMTLIQPHNNIVCYFLKGQLMLKI